MHAHTVIEDLQAQVLAYSMSEVLRLSYMNACTLIKEAHKFHIDDFKGVVESVNGVDPHPLSDDSSGLRPPYDLCWFEYRVVHTEPGSASSRQSKIGILVKHEVDTLYTMHMFQPYYADPLGRKAWGMYPVLQYLSFGKVFNAIDIGKAEGKVIFHYEFLMDQIVRSPNLGDLALCLLPLSKDPVKVMNDFRELANASLAVLINTLHVLSCKNIDTETVPPPAKLNKKRLKNGKPPIYEYKTLVLRPTTKKQREMAAQGNWDQRLHWRRGHRKTYTEEKPLFGKYAGTWWWQPGMQGNRELGVVEKDYEVRTS